jgi:uroporphyrinogen-III synthase
MRKLLLLRPERGLSASAERARALGLKIIRCPLFCIEPVEWSPPDPANYDALLLTSANAVRAAGLRLKTLASLPVHAVGQATADAARDAGFQVETVGESDIVDLLGRAPAGLRLLHLAGEDHRQVDDGRIERRIVYRAAEIDEAKLPPLAGLVVAVHSRRAGKRLAELAGDRAETIIVAISPAAAAACEEGWERVEAAAEPNDNSLLALAASLCQTPLPQ